MSSEAYPEEQKQNIKHRQSDGRTDGLCKLQSTYAN